MNRRPPGIWVTNHLANPLLRPLLRGPAGHRLGRHLALLRYHGRRAGRVYELPVQYASNADRVWILPGAPGHKTWWRNLRGGAAVELVLAGHEHHGQATVIGPSQRRVVAPAAQPDRRRRCARPPAAAPCPLNQQAAPAAGGYPRRLGRLAAAQPAGTMRSCHRQAAPWTGDLRLYLLRARPRLDRSRSGMGEGHGQD